MNLLRLLFGALHEGLHVLALWLIGRRPERVTISHVDIPGDLSTGRYVFVAIFPTVVFLLIAAFGLVGMASAGSIMQFGVALVMAIIGSIGAVGGLGDLHLITLRLAQDAELAQHAKRVDPDRQHPDGQSKSG